MRAGKNISKLENEVDQDADIEDEDPDIKNEKDADMEDEGGD